ncbi:MAG TPA: hypothetical protein VF861_17100, partial [Telluria sp.]
CAELARLLPLPRRQAICLYGSFSSWVSSKRHCPLFEMSMKPGSPQTTVSSKNGSEAPPPCGKSEALTGVAPRAVCDFGEKIAKLWSVPGFAVLIAEAG